MNFLRGICAKGTTHNTYYQTLVLSLLASQASCSTQSTLRRGLACQSQPSPLKYRQLLTREILHAAFGTMATPSGTDLTVERLIEVEGYGGEKNDVLHCRKIHSSADSSSDGHVFFFGGDVQDYPENMLAHRDNKRYVAWNLENTCRLLATRFPKHDVWVVRPNRLQLKTFSVYSSFVVSDDIGCPDHSMGQSSWQHLAALFQKAQSSVESAGADGADEPKPAEVVNRSISLVGFSKGCVVLNQLLYDLESAKLADDRTRDFVSKVKAIFWLDGGHNGGKYTWVTSDIVLESLVGMDIELISHVTPYQVKDSMRKWIGQEQKRFVEKLKKLKLNVKNTLHFGEEDRSLENHFNILKEF